MILLLVATILLLAAFVSGLALGFVLGAAVVLAKSARVILELGKLRARRVVPTTDQARGADPRTSTTRTAGVQVPIVHAGSAFVRGRES